MWGHHCEIRCTPRCQPVRLASARGLRRRPWPAPSPASTEQDRELTALDALRGALRAAHDDLPPADREARRERDLAILEVPELWATDLHVLAEALGSPDELVAARVGRPRRTQQSGR